MPEPTPPNRTDSSLWQSAERRIQVDTFYDKGVPDEALRIILEWYRDRFLARLQKGFTPKGSRTRLRVDDQEEAENIFNHAVAKFHEHRASNPEYRGDGTQGLEPMLWTIVRNLAVDYLRRRRNPTESVLGSADAESNRPFDRMADKTFIATSAKSDILDRLGAKLEQYARADERLSWAPGLWQVLCQPEGCGRPRPTDQELAVKLNCSRALAQSRRTQIEQLVIRAAEELGIT